MIAGGVALTGLSFVGFKTMDYAKGKTRAYLVQRIQAMARAAVFGYGLPPEAHCIINDLQAVVLKAGQSKLEEII